MPLVLREEKGSQLTYNELDGNFTYLQGLDQEKLTTSSFNTFSSSYATGSFTGSFVGDGSGLTGIPGVTPISTGSFVTTSSFNAATGSFATTGSNQFRAAQTISGSLTVSGSIRQTGIGEANTFVGAGAGFANFPSLGTYNTFIGTSAGQANTSGTGNLAIGASALNQNINGDSNVAIGNEAGSWVIGFGVNTGAQNSIFIGHNAQSQLVSQTNQIVIGNFAEGNGNNTTTIGNDTTIATYLKGTLITSGSVAQRVTGSFLMSGSANIRGGVTGSSFTGSFVGDGSGLTGIPGVTPIDTGSFATTGSNIFVGNQTITGSLILSSSAAIELTVIGNQTLTSGSLIVTGSSLFVSPSYGNGIGVNNSGSRFTQNTTTVSMAVKPSGSFNFGSISVSDNNDGNSTVNLYGSTLLIGNTSANSILFGNASSNTNLLGTYNFRAGINVTGSLIVTGSANINGFMTYPQVSASLNFANDTAAASGGVPLGGIYRSGSFVLIRLV